MTVRDAAEAREALTAGTPELLTGTRECAWLVAKSQPYQLDQPRSAAELAKDVAALANTGGGVIVIGLRTRRVGSSEVIDEVRPVPAELRPGSLPEAGPRTRLPVRQGLRHLVAASR